MLRRKLGNRVYKFVNKRTKAIVYFLDIIGYGLSTALKIFKPWKGIQKRTIPVRQKKILIIRADYIGDVVLATPVLKPLREKFKDDEITFLTSKNSMEILESNPHIDRVIGYDPPWFFRIPVVHAFREYLKLREKIIKEKYEIAVDLRGDLRNIFFLMFLCKIPRRVSFGASGGGYLLTDCVKWSQGRHESDYHMDLVEYLGGDKKRKTMPQIYLSKLELAQGVNFMASLFGEKTPPVVIIHPGARTPMKRWKPERYSILAERLISEYGVNILFTGSPNESGLVEDIMSRMKSKAVSIAGRVNSLMMLASIIKKSSLLIAPSTGPVHIASAIGVPVIVLSGPESSAQWGPLGSENIVIQKYVPCRPCQEVKCSQPVNNCLNMIEVDEVIGAFRTLYNKIVSVDNVCK